MCKNVYIGAGVVVWCFYTVNTSAATCLKLFLNLRLAYLRVELTHVRIAVDVVVAGDGGVAADKCLQQTVVHEDVLFLEKQRLMLNECQNYML